MIQKSACIAVFAAMNGTYSTPTVTSKMLVREEKGEELHLQTFFFDGQALLVQGHDF